MSRLLIIVFIATALRASAQRVEDLKLQIHGYATQGFAYTTKNNWNLMDSTSGGFKWTDVVLSVSSQPKAAPKLRVGAQGRYFRLGDIPDRFNLDWAQADYKVSESFGVRGGKVKTPIGLLNESQDIDPAQLWVLLPQSVYPIASRNSILAHYGGVVYGTINLGEALGKLEYRGFGGQRSVAGDDGYFQSTRDEGFKVPNGVSGHVSGATLRWNAPIQGLMLGISESSGALHGALQYGPYPGALNLPNYYNIYYYGRFERGPLMLAGEFSRLPVSATVTVAGYPVHDRSDQRAFYGMASYKLAAKLTAGMYYSSFFDTQHLYDSFRYQKDWALAGRYDINSYVYTKLEQHFIDGNAVGVSTTDNANLQPNNRMTLVKLGVSF